ncbi:acyl-CoA synthetase [Aeromicrobium sp. Root344]|uniref:class I adenylate-forming enzyme family protein n=1 Tax=Aeromicrobium sp. Root344 TaxID=1736521 RepID=UPI0006F200A0|nr:class I adenylate-forming enzyme family protein [Aeromicrobium sp. Root344]KQV73796.1 acyl-CoA synthetase [Aeromicrobium sp. Root344]
MQKLVAEFSARATATPDAVAAIDASGPHTTAEVLRQAEELAGVLETIVDGAPTVLVQADNTWRTLAAALAVGMRGGLIAVVSRHATPGEFAIACSDLVPDVVIASEPVVIGWDVPADHFSARDTALDGWTVAARQGATAGVERWRGGVVVAMTSGSTGRPKCVVQSEDALRYAGQCTIDAVGLQPGDPVGALVPLSSVAAFCFGMYLPAMLGSPMVTLDGWDPSAALRVLAEHDVRWTMLVPTMALQLSIQPGAEGSLSSLTAMTVGGGPMDSGALGRAERTLGTKFLRVFGMSECLGHTTPLPGESEDVRLGRDGRPFPGTTVRVVGEDGVPRGAGEVGQLQVQGPSFFVGYARNGAPEPPAVTADGFFPTGDLARINPDGTLNIVGREKQIIIRGGRNIDINEVEAAIAQMPDVAQVCVVPVPDELLGERAAALIVTTGTELDLDAVTAHLDAAGFAKFKWPEFVHRVAALPQNRVGKLSRDDAVRLATDLSRTPG